MTVTRGDPGDRDWKRRATRAWGGAAPAQPYAKRHAAGTVALGPGRPWRWAAAATWLAAGLPPAALAAGTGLWIVDGDAARPRFVLGIFAALPFVGAALGQAAWIGHRLGAPMGWRWLGISLVGLALVGYPAWALLEHLLPAMLGPRPSGDAMAGTTVLGLVGLLAAGVPGRFQAGAVRGSRTFVAVWGLLAAFGGAAGAILWSHLLPLPLRDVLPALTTGQAGLLGLGLAAGPVLATAAVAGRAFPEPGRAR